MDERKRDLARLDGALDVLMDMIGKVAPAESDDSFLELFSDRKLKAIDRLAPLLKRRAEMLGYDARAGDEAAVESTIDRMTREIAAQGQKQPKS